MLKRFEKHEFQPFSSAEQGIRQACMQLQTLSWDQLLEHGAQLATSLALDCLILKAGEFAMSPAGRNFMHDITETLKLPPPRAQEYMVELAGIGKIALEEGVEVVTALAESSAEVLAHKGSTLTHILKNGALLKAASSTPNGGNTPQTPLAPPVGLGIIREVEKTLKETIIEYSEHIFSADHRRKGIMSLGKDQETIINSLYDIIKAVDEQGLLKNGLNQIKATINGVSNVEIKCFIETGDVLSVNAYISNFARVYGNFIIWK